MCLYLGTNNRFIIAKCTWEQIFWGGNVCYKKGWGFATLNKNWQPCSKVPVIFFKISSANSKTINLRCNQAVKLDKCEIFEEYSVLIS